MMMEYFKIPKKTPIVSEKGGHPPPSSTPCQDTGEKTSSPPLVGGCRDVQNLRTPPIESEKGGPAPPSSAPCQETGEISSTPPPDGGYREVPKSRTPPTESPLPPRTNRIENSSGYLSNTGQPIGSLGVNLRYVGGKTPTGTTLRNVPHCGRLNIAGESRSPPHPPPASTTLKTNTNLRVG